MCICVSQEGEELSSCLWSITHPCIVGRKVTSFCAFLWAIVIPQLNSFEFIQPSWILSVYFYIRGERQPRREREEEKPYRFCRVYNGIYTEAWNSSYKYFRTLISAEINPGNTPRVNKGDLFSALPHLPLLAAPLEAFAEVGWAWTRGKPWSQQLPAGFGCCLQELSAACRSGGGSLCRGCWAPEVWLWLMFEWSCYLQGMKYTAGVPSFKEGLGKHLCMEIPHQGYWWALIYSWVE